MSEQAFDLNKPVVGVLMGSKSDWPIMEHTHKTLNDFGVPHEIKVLSAHRTPAQTMEYVSSAEERGIEVLIGAAGGAAHLCGVIAAHTVLPVIGIPIPAWSLDGLDSLLSTVQMPGGMPVATVAIGKAGAKNAALLAVSILGTKRTNLRDRLREYRKQMAEQILATELPIENPPGTVKA